MRDTVQAEHEASADGGPDRFEYPITVRPEDIDVNGHANNVVYVRWIQEAAVAHWFAVVDAERAGTMTWAVVRHEVDYKRPALLGDALVARTWVGAITAATCERFCEISRPSDATTLARSRTIWCVFDPATGRPRRIDPAIRGYFSGRLPAAGGQAGGTSADGS